MKKHLTLIILLVVCAVLIGGYFGLQAYLNRDVDNGEPVVLTLTTFKMDDVNMITSEWRGDKIVIKRSGLSWKRADEADFPLDLNVTAAFINAASSILTQRIVDDNLDNIAAYGLDDPMGTIEVVSKEGEVKRIYIGDRNSTTSNYYLYMEGNSNVYSIDFEVWDSLTYSVVDFVMVDTMPDITFLTGFTVSTRDEGVVLEIKPYDEAPETGISDEQIWYVEQPYEYPRAADYTAIGTYQGKLMYLDFSTCMDYTDDEAVLAGYGLTDPYATVHVNYDMQLQEYDGENYNYKYVGLEKDLLIGDKIPDSNKRYVKFADSDIVLSAYDIDIDYLVNVDPESFLSANVCPVPPGSLAELSFLADGLDYTLSLTHEFKPVVLEDGTESTETVSTAYRDGVMLDGEAYMAMYEKIYALSVQSRLENAPDTIGDQVLSIRFIREDDELELKVYKYDISFYLCEFMGDKTMLVNVRDVNDIIEMAKGL